MQSATKARAETRDDALLLTAGEYLKLHEPGVWEILTGMNDPCAGLKADSDRAEEIAKDLGAPMGIRLVFDPQVCPQGQLARVFPEAVWHMVYA